jgi:lysophospholipase L1-like esterase
MQTKSKRLIIVAAVGMTLLGLAFAYLYFWLSRPIGSGAAGPEVSLQKFSQPWTERPVVLVGIGDSVTAGFGARKGYSYFDLLVTNPPDEYDGMREVCLGAVLPKLQFTNLAVSGSTSLEHVERQLPRLPVFGSNVVGLVVITTGGNDLIHNYGRTPPRDQAMYGATVDEAKPWIEAFQNRLESMMGGIEAHFPGGCQIFLANIFDPTDGVGDTSRAGLPPWDDGPKILESYNKALQLCAERHSNVHLVDVHTAFLGHGIHCTQFWSKHYDLKDPHYWYFVNLEDPNERGYDVIRRLFLLEIAKMADQLR